ncbi:hypothetical protein Hs30E_13000 [Lactococcus hodotermopsidis]|uniref:DUF1617 domain-containing protein n=1 Tax=Pseudolactococcus hodotermopsidis TaxID=2709157 RepID=A0A6A0BBB0_9LACT|nr:DUF1617 family protein [Lactococcus hodotermopsidis]GFH42749.1 hypothetical protein Hs30E_13000 [Lactococcus hodotermopsidis]
MLTFKNQELAPVINFLGKLALAPKASRCRSKLIKKLMEKYEEFSEDEKNLFEKYGERDDKGNLVKTDDGNYKLVPETAKECLKEQRILVDEEVMIALDEIEEKVKYLVAQLDELDIEFSGNDAVIYDTLMDKLEEEI